MTSEACNAPDSGAAVVVVEEEEQETDDDSGDYGSFIDCTQLEVIKANRKWNDFYLENGLNGSNEGKTAVVRFAEKISSIHFFEDDKDSKDNRCIYWELYAADRQRFKDRIHRTEAQLKHIFDESHRKKIFNERFKEPQEN